PGRDLLGYLSRLTERFADFGRTADSNKGVKGFIDYVREVGPKVASFFGNLVGAFINIARAAAPLGELLIGAFDELFKLIRRADPGVLAGIAAGIGAIMLAFGVGNPLIAIAGIVAGLAMLYKRSKSFRKVVDTVWAGVKKAFGAIARFVREELGPVISRFWNKVARPAFKGLGVVIRDLWKGVIGPAFRGIAKL